MKKRIIQVAHITSTPGPVQTLAEFLGNKKDIDLKKIYFDLDNSILGYILDFFVTLDKLSKMYKIDVAIGMNCFDTLPLILLRKNRIKKIVFFGTDFARKRFKNPILNWFYIKIDGYCAKKADWVCCNSQRTIKQRLVEGVNKNKIIYTPNGLFLKKTKTIKKEYKKKLVFIGRIDKEHGLLTLISRVNKASIKMDVIGDGPELVNLQNSFKESRYIKFLGEKTHSEVMDYLLGFGGFGVAPYIKTGLDWTYYCDPVKVKEYLACGVPVIVSDVPEIAKVIKKEEFGFVYKNKKDLEMVLDQLKKIDRNDYQQMVKRIKLFRLNFDLNKIYERIFKVIVSTNSD